MYIYAKVGGVGRDIIIVRSIREFNCIQGAFPLLILKIVRIDDFVDINRKPGMRLGSLRVHFSGLNPPIP